MWPGTLAWGKRMAQGNQQITSLVKIPEFVMGLRKLKESDFRGIAGVLEYLKAHPIDPASLEPFLMWDRQHYTRNLVDHTDLYDLIAICWEIGQCSSIHNHKGQNCWMTVPVGRLLVQNYHVKDESLEEQRCDLEPTNVVEMNPGAPLAVDPNDPVHSVYNPKEFGERAVSLHVYSHPFDSCVVYSVEQHTCGEIKLHFNSMYGIPSKH
jgi:cysteine dioxygenase